MSLLQVTSCGRQIDLAIAQDLSITLEDSGIGDSISIPVCDGSLTITAADFSPLSLFQSGEQGVWYDPSDFSTMFQDSAGTTPVTAVGQAVGRILDKSGRGNHASQATPTARPILRQDGSGRYYLEFDGVDDVLFTGAVNPAGVDKAQAFLGTRKLSDTGRQMFFETSAGSGTGFGSVSTNRATAGDLDISMVGSISGGPSERSTGYTAPRTMVLSVACDMAAATVAAQINLRVNAAVPTVTNPGTLAVGTFSSGPIYIGARGTGTLRLNGWIYGLIIRFSASNAIAQTISDTETWMNLRTGAY